MRGRRCSLFVTVMALAADQAKYVAEFIKTVVAMSTDSSPAQGWIDWYGDLESVNIVTCGYHPLGVRPGRERLSQVKAHLNYVIGVRPPVDWAVDAKEFHIRGEDHKLSYHLGTNALVQRTVAPCATNFCRVGKI